MTIGDAILFVSFRWKGFCVELLTQILFSVETKSTFHREAVVLKRGLGQNLWKAFYPSRWKEGSLLQILPCNRHNVERMVALDQWTCAPWTVADHTVVWGIHQVLTFTRAWPRKVCSSLWSSPLSHLVLSTGQGLERACQNSWQFMRKATWYTMWGYSLVLGTRYLVHHEKVLLGAPVHVKVDQALEA